MKYIAMAVWAARAVGKISSILLKYSTFAVYFHGQEKYKIRIFAKNVLKI